MIATHTGNFPIGFRLGWSDWQKDAPGALEWARSAGLGVIDLPGDAARVALAHAAGFRIGSVDLATGWSALASADPGKRADALATNEALIAACAPLGGVNFFTVLIPEDPAKSRRDNFGATVEAAAALGAVLEKHGAKLVIEGWPGPGAFGCTPSSYREVIEAANSPAIGINYDPSHLVRMGIDPIRFVEEFGARVFHVHGKDTELFPEAAYEFGSEQPATFAAPHGFGSHVWRYAIPGHGCVRWTSALQRLRGAGYAGCVSIELEDENFNGSEEGEKRGILAGARFLADC